MQNKITKILLGAVICVIVLVSALEIHEQRDQQRMEALLERVDDYKLERK